MRGYDYANEGAYFLTICTHERQPLFCRIADGVMASNALGVIAQRCWDAIPEHMPHVDVGPFVVMPNHVHGIVIIRERYTPAGADHGRPVDGPADNNAPANEAGNDGTANAPHAQYPVDHGRPLPPPTNDAPPKRPMPTVPPGSLGRIVAAYKSSVTRIAYRDGVMPRGTTVWQRNYWDDIIRGDGAYERMAQYIADNPKNWKGDRFNR